MTRHIQLTDTEFATMMDHMDDLSDPNYPATGWVAEWHREEMSRIQQQAQKRAQEQELRIESAIARERRNARISTEMGCWEQVVGAAEKMDALLKTR